MKEEGKKALKNEITRKIPMKDGRRRCRKENDFGMKTLRWVRIKAKKPNPDDHDTARGT